MPDLSITYCSLVNENRIVECDLLISNQRIDNIAPDLQRSQAKRVLDAKGMHVIPGMIDDQVHFREPGLTHLNGQLIYENGILSNDPFFDEPLTFNR